ncbi:MAG: hypothetical protein HRT90_08330 [Candidatus Margulisbacteria bacterium]|nr:hypothetical protein [Candidatus Margulisiibacteriota bacterium]
MKKVFFFILLPICLTVLGEVLLKISLNALSNTLSFSSALGIMTNPFVLLSILIIILGGLLWLVGMSKFELSFMYPFLSINYILIMLGSAFILNESISIYRLISTGFIITGLIFITRSPYSEEHEYNK